jgi:lipopolysaccharide heptosyltransferase II
LEKFLIINPFGIGDVLFTAPVIRAIKEYKPDTFLAYWCNLRVRELLKHNERIDKIFALSRGDFKKLCSHSKLEGLRKSLDLFFGLKRENFGIALDYSLDHRYGLVCKLAGIRKRVGFDYKGRGRFLTDKLELTGYNDKHVVEYYLDLLRFIGIKPAGAGLELKASREDKIRAQVILSGCGIKKGDLLIGIAPGGGESWGRDASLKRWPREKFAQLADRIIANLSAKVLLLADENERAVTEAIISKMNKKVIDLTGRTKLTDLAALIESLDLLIANDGGPLHIGAALGKKTVSFFGPVDPFVYGPYPFSADRHIVLRRKIECGPCYRNFRLSGCSRDKECLRSISVDEAEEAVSSLLLTKEKK